MRQTLRSCKWCGSDFIHNGARGPLPVYCSNAHKQRAYEQRNELGRKWYCTFHGRLAGEETAAHLPEFCWYEYRHECELVLVALRQVGAKK